MQAWSNKIGFQTRGSLRASPNPALERSAQQRPTLGSLLASLVGAHSALSLGRAETLMVDIEPTFRPATGDDALCISVLAAQVFVDTYATHGIREAIARHVTGGKGVRPRLVFLRMWSMRRLTSWSSARFSASAALQVSPASPIVMAFSTLEPVVCDLDANAIGISEERCPVVGRILSVELCLRCLNADAAKLSGYRRDFGRRINAEAKVVQPRGIGIACGLGT